MQVYSLFRINPNNKYTENGSIGRFFDTLRLNLIYEETNLYTRPLDHTRD